MKGRFLLTIASLLLTINSAAQVAYTYTSTGAGKMTTATVPNRINITNLTVTGNIDARDVKFMRDDMPMLAMLDMSGATIVSYDTYPANELPDYAFTNPTTFVGKASLVSVELPAGLTGIGNSAFDGCGGLSGVLTLPAGVISIGKYAFYNCSGITGTLTLPKDLASIGHDAFRGCSGLTALVLPANLTDIDDAAFQDCSNLTSIISHNPTPVEIYKNRFVFIGVSTSSCTLTVPTSATNAYKNANGWRNFTNTSGGGYIFVATTNNAQRGTVSGTTSGFYTTGTSIEVTATPATGYTLAKWTNRKGDNLGNTVQLEFTLTQDSVLTAQFEAIAYGITYNNLNGATNYNPGSYTIESTVILVAPSAREHYTFDGWSNGGYIAAGSMGDKTFTAYWSATQYTITYVLDGGTNHADNPATYTIESDTIILQAPTKAGYRFEGWQEGDTIAAGSTGSKTFTAHWTIMPYTITYELNGGTNHESNPAGYTIKDTPITLQAPTKTGYTFEGWQEGDTIAKGGFGDKTFTAQWTATLYTITYLLDGGTNHADNPETYTIESDTIILQAATKEGYLFEKWKEGDTITAGSTGNKTFTAQWLKGCTVTFDTNGGSLIPTQTVLPGSTITLPDPPTRTNYTFIGWFSDPSYTNHWNFAIDIVGTDFTLYAKWELAPISAYPNPTAGIVHIINNANDAEVLVYTINGKLLQRRHAESINLSGYPAGIYLLRIAKTTLKIIKQ